jgi:hypothetical protein
MNAIPVVDMGSRMIDSSKINAVRKYLEREFPNLDVTDFPDQERTAHCFRLDENGIKHLVTATLEFFSFNATENIPTTLQRWGLAETLRSVGRTPVLVMTTGIQIDNTSGEPEDRYRCT